MSEYGMGSHYDEETLIRVAECDVEIEDAHIAECGDCRAAVEEYREMLSCLADDSVWDHRPLNDTPDPQTIATLRSFVDTMHREDAEAEPLVAELLAGSREEWMPRLMADAKYRTAGVVRKLIAMMPELLRTVPADASVVADVAVSVADELVETSRRSETQQLRGSAWREYAFAHLFVGNYDIAIRASREAAAAFTRCGVSEYDEARLAVLDAQIARAHDRVEDGLAAINRAVAIFEASDDTSRITSTTMVKAALLARGGNFRAAISLMRELLSIPRDLPTMLRATLHANLGYCHREIGEFAEALENLEVAAFIFDELHITADAVRTRWNVAVVLQRAGKLREAAQRLRSVITEFDALGMVGPSALAVLDLAEIHLAERDYETVASLCGRAMEQFSASGVAYSERARTAIAMICEASAGKKASIALVRSVSHYLRELPSDPKLEFAFLPPPQD